MIEDTENAEIGKFIEIRRMRVVKLNQVVGQIVHRVGVISHEETGPRVVDRPRGRDSDNTGGNRMAVLVHAFTELFAGFFDVWPNAVGGEGSLAFNVDACASVVDEEIGASAELDLPACPRHSAGKSELKGRVAPDVGAMSSFFARMERATKRFPEEGPERVRVLAAEASVDVAKFCGVDERPDEVLNVVAIRQQVESASTVRVLDRLDVSSELPEPVWTLVEAEAAEEGLELCEVLDYL